MSHDLIQHFGIEMSHDEFNRWVGTFSLCDRSALYRGDQRSGQSNYILCGDKAFHDLDPLITSLTKLVSAERVAAEERTIAGFFIIKQQRGIKLREPFRHHIM